MSVRAKSRPPRSKRNSLLGVPGAQPYVLAVADVQLARQPAGPIETHGTHRTLPSVPRLVERDRHDPIDVPTPTATSPLPTVPLLTGPSHLRNAPSRQGHERHDGVMRSARGRVARGGAANWPQPSRPGHCACLRPRGGRGRERRPRQALGASPPFQRIDGSRPRGRPARRREHRSRRRRRRTFSPAPGVQGGNPMSDWSTAALSRATHWRRCTLGRTIRPSLQEDKNSVTSERGIPAAPSRSAGRYLCNFLYYLSLDWATRQEQSPAVLFVHIPPFTAHGGPLARPCSRRR